VECDYAQEAASRSVVMCSHAEARLVWGTHPCVKNCAERCMFRAYQGKPKPPTVVQKIATFSRSVTSRGVTASLTQSSGQRAAIDVWRRRVASCFGGDKACEAVVTKAGRRFCSLCGCGTAARAALDADGGVVAYDGPYTKLHYPYLVCPLNKDGFDKR
jgi:hypothetical protein